jgi:hypothetical protein
MRLTSGLEMIFFLCLAVPIKADTLFKEKIAIAFGHGTVDGHTIHWVDCSGQNMQDYVAPPYWLDKADNCSLRPTDIGLETSSGKYVIKDEKKFKVFFPSAKAGGTAGFRVMSKSVEITYDGKTVNARK